MTRDDLLARYRDGYRAVTEALAQVDLDARTTPQDWSPREIVHHLADATAIAGVRLRRLLAEDEPAINSYDEARYARDLHYDRPVDSSLALFEAAVVANVELLERISEQDWERKGTHDEYPDGYSIDLWLERQAGHVHEHAEQIARCAR